MISWVASVILSRRWEVFRRAEERLAPSVADRGPGGELPARQFELDERERGVGPWRRIESAAQCGLL